MIREEDAHRAFRALLVAMATPGRWQSTPASSAEDAVDLLRYAAWEGDPFITVAESGAAAAALADADPGTEDEPERSTTVVLVASDGAGSAVVISGPGVRDTLPLDLPMDAAALATRQEKCARFPIGVDIVFVDRAGRVLGLPRTSAVRSA